MKEDLHQSYLELKYFDKKLTRKMTKIKESNRKIGSLESAMREIATLLDEALNVKLRYQEIIARLI